MIGGRPCTRQASVSNPMLEQVAAAKPRYVEGSGSRFFSMQRQEGKQGAGAAGSDVEPPIARDALPSEQRCDLARRVQQARLAEPTRQAQEDIGVGAEADQSADRNRESPGPLRLGDELGDLGTQGSDGPQGEVASLRITGDLMKGAQEESDSRRAIVEVRTEEGRSPARLGGRYTPRDAAVAAVDRAIAKLPSDSCRRRHAS